MFGFNLETSDLLSDTLSLSASQPTQSEIVSITGALIVVSFLTSCVLLTHLFNALSELHQKVHISDFVVGGPRSLSVFLGKLSMNSVRFLVIGLSRLCYGIKCSFFNWLWKNQKKKFL